MSADQTSELSKSARKRANQKAKAAEAAAAAAAEAAPPAPAPKAKAETAPKSKAKAKAKAEAAPAPAPEPKAKAKAKGKAEPEPAPKAESKAKAKAKAEAKAPAAAEAQPKAAAKSAEGKAKAKPKPKPKAEEEAPKRKESLEFQYEMDDGKGGDWEVASAVSKKQAKRQEKLAEQKQKAEEEAIAAAKEAARIKKEAAKAAKSGASPEAVLAQAKAKAAAEPKPAVAAAPAPAVAAVAAVTTKAPEKKEEKPAEPDPNVTATVKVPQEKIGRVIGPKGANITKIKEKTGVKNIDTSGGEVCTIVGLPAEVALAEKAVTELVEKGFMSLAYEDFKEDALNVAQTSIPNIIGERGSIIEIIRKECEVEVDIQQVPKGSKKEKVKVTIAGESAGVEKAKEIISALSLFSYHEVTHPGYTHRELDVEEHKYRFIIGKGGCEMRHIQNNFKVKVTIPREGSTSDKVVVVGDANDVERAVKYIEKTLYDAEQNTKKDARQDKADDYWASKGEDTEEAWMSPYMYKRKA